VYLNRLAHNMRLEADPTVQYALGYQASEGSWWKKELTYKDLEVASPYNTYRNNGLPPGPICSPGLAALEAVARPAAADFLYFVAKGDGSHAFSRTFEEHISNVRKYRK